MTSEGKYSVYKHCSPSGKVYIGITKQNPEVRWKGGKGYSDNTYFIRAIEKYGWDAFTHEVLMSGLSKENACKIEESLIAQYRSYDRNYGYNIALGGEANCPTDETKEKISESVSKKWRNSEFRQKAVSGMKGKRRSDKSIANISRAQKKRFERLEERIAVGEKSKGRTRSEEAKRKTSESLKQYYGNPSEQANRKAYIAERNKKLRKPVLCVETGTIYESVTIAAESLGLTHQNLSACLRGKRNTFGGFHWMWIGEENVAV